MLTDKIRENINIAAKERDLNKVQTLRLLLSSLEYKKMQKLADLSSEDEIAVVKSEVKKRQEAIEIYEKAGATERADAEKAELLILMEYMPSQADEVVVSKTVQEV